MGDQNPHMLAVNAGSSSVKLALFEMANVPRKIIEGSIEKIGQGQAEIMIQDPAEPISSTEAVEASDHMRAAEILVERFKRQLAGIAPYAVGHRIVHGGPKYYETRQIDDELIAYLRGLTHFDPEHLPTELRLIEVFKKLLPEAKQFACFDTAFHHDLPAVARLLPIPRRYEAQGVRRYGFHGLSYAYVMRRLREEAGEQAAAGRVILAHLGNGVSLAAVRGGHSIDTTMAMTPAGGLPMSTRSGDLDPGLVLYLALSEGVDAQHFNDLVNFQSGLLGLSETTSDMKQLLEIENHDTKAKEAVDLFCYQMKKAIGGLAAVMGGVDTLLFTGGMGEKAPKIRSQVCAGLEFLGIRIDEVSNLSNESLISAAGGKTAVRVIRTDEAATIASEVQKISGSAG